MNINPKLDLVITKTLDATPEQIWKAWTTADTFKDWFCPKPWSVIEARVNAQPGGEFYTVMQSPEGDKFPGAGCVLEAIPNKKLSWTSVLLPDFRPNDAEGMKFTGTILLEAQGNQTKYTAIARHGNEADCDQHRSMGFEQGWGICADQLVAFIKR